MDVTKKAPDYLEDEHLSVGTKEYLKVLNASDTPVESLSPQDARNVLIGAQAGVDVDLSGIDESEKTIHVEGQDIKLNIVRPTGKNEKLPVFIFIHGGGWVLGDYPTHKRLVRDIVVESGFAAVFVNYTPSPEAKYPKAINQIYAATKWVAENGDEINVDGKTLGVIGNSVGGNMTMVTSLMAKEENGPEIKAQVLMWPVTDATFDWGSWKEYGEQRFLTSSLMKWMFDNYTTDEEDRKDPHMSPLQASLDQLRGLPPTLIEVAENDILRDEGEALGRKLDEAGVFTTTIRFNGVTHDWGLLNGFAKLSPVRSLALFTAAFLKKYLVQGEDGLVVTGTTTGKVNTAAAGVAAGAVAGSAFTDKEKVNHPKGCGCSSHSTHKDHVEKATTAAAGAVAGSALTDKEKKDDNHINAEHPHKTEHQKAEHPKGCGCSTHKDQSENRIVDTTGINDEPELQIGYSEVIIIEKADEADNMQNDNKA